MNMKTLCLISAVLMAMSLCKNICPGGEVTARINEGGWEYHADIAVAFMFYHEGRGRIADMHRTGDLGQPYYVHVMIWQDGHILFCEQPDESAARVDDRTYKFQRGVVDKNSISELQEKLVSLFRLKNQRTNLWDYGPGGSYKVLAINANDFSVRIATWEQWRNAESRSPRMMLHEDNAVDGKAMFLGEFYEKWREAKKEIYAFVEQLDSGKLIPVDVTIDDDKFKSPPVMRIFDKDGTLLLEQKLRRDPDQPK